MTRLILLAALTIATIGGAYLLLSPPQRAFHLAGMRVALDAMEAVR